MEKLTYWLLFSLILQSTFSEELWQPLMISSGSFFPIAFLVGLIWWKNKQQKMEYTAETHRFHNTILRFSPTNSLKPPQMVLRQSLVKELWVGCMLGSSNWSERHPCASGGEMVESQEGGWTRRKGRRARWYHGRVGNPWPNWQCQLGSPAGILRGEPHRLLVSELHVQWVSVWVSLQARRKLGQWRHAQSGWLQVNCHWNCTRPQILAGGLFVQNHSSGPANILLDDTGRAKVNDLWVVEAGLGSRGGLHRDETTPRGKFRYNKAPECGQHDKTVTENTNVFSYGVMLLELLCGWKKILCSDTAPKMYLAPYAQKMVKGFRCPPAIRGLSGRWSLTNVSSSILVHAVWCFGEALHRHYVEVVTRGGIVAWIRTRCVTYRSCTPHWWWPELLFP